MDTEALDYWKQIANRRWGKYTRAIEALALAEAKRHVAVGTALEIGAEQGFFANDLVNEGWNVVATEICPQKVEMFNANNHGAQCVLVSPTSCRLPFKDAEVDLVISMEVPTNHEAWFCKEVARILTAHGAVVFTTFNKNSYRGLLANMKGRIKGGEIYYRVAYSEVKARFLAAGFTPCYETGFCWAPFARTSDSLLVPCAAFIESCLKLRAIPGISPWVASVFTRTPLQQSTRETRTNAK